MLLGFAPADAVLGGPVAQHNLICKLRSMWGIPPATDAACRRICIPRCTMADGGWRRGLPPARVAHRLARFRHEARAASALNHQHICTICDTGESLGRPFLSMELVEGRTSESWGDLRRPVHELAGLLGHAAQALAAAHAAGVVHRHIKPANLIVRDDGILKVLDFGLARCLSSGFDAPRQAAPTPPPGARLGNLSYMSPEQARAESVDTATDIFSLGVALYELATGYRPRRSIAVPVRGRSGTGWFTGEPVRENDGAGYESVQPGTGVVGCGPRWWRRRSDVGPALHSKFGASNTKSSAALMYSGPADLS